jgi:hypothetical protein
MASTLQPVSRRHERRRLRKSIAMKLEERAMRPVAVVVLSCTLLSLASAPAGAETQTLSEARWIVPHGKGSREIEVALSLENDRLILESRDGEVLRSIPYDSVRTISHATERKRRWLGGLGLGVLVHPLGFGLLLTKSKAHYVTVQHDGADTILKLRSGDYTTTLSALATALPHVPFRPGR